jgi:hypothetical protein
MAYSVSFPFTAKGSSSQVNVTVNGREVGVTPQYAADAADGRDAVHIAAARQFWASGRRKLP